MSEKIKKVLIYNRIFEYVIKRVSAGFFQGVKRLPSKNVHFDINSYDNVFNTNCRRQTSLYYT